MSYNCLERRTLTFVDKLTELDEEDNKLKVCRKELSQEPIVSEIQENSDEMFSKVSYETFLESIVPIGYKFECEEENNQSKSTLEDESKTIEQLDTQKHNSYEIKIEKLSADEIRALAGDDYLKYESLNNRVVMLDKKRKIDPKPKSDELNVLTKEKDVTETENLEEVAEREVIEKVDEKKLEDTSGELYIAWGDEVVDARKRARKLVQEFNNTDPEDRKLTYSILNKLLGRVGEYIHIEPDFKCTYGKNIKVGDNFYAGYNCVILDQAEVTIGCNCIISPQVGIYTVGYPLEYDMRIAGYEYAKPITIGDNVWIGGGSIINPGVTIGSNVVVAAGAVVSENIPDNVMVEGNPAHIIKYLNKAE